MSLTVDDIIKIITALTVITGAGITWYNSRGNRRKDTVDELYRLIDLLQKRVDGQDKKLTELEAENKRLDDWVRRLIQQLMEAGLTPVSSDTASLQ